MDGITICLGNKGCAIKKMFLLKDKMIGSSTSHGIQLGKRPALSTSLEKAGKKRAAEEDDTHRIIHLTVKGQVIYTFRGTHK